MTVILLGWAAMAALLAVSATQWAGFDRWRPLAVLQALTPWALLCALPLGVAAALLGEPGIAIAALAPLATLAWLVWPGVAAQRPAGTGDPTITVFFGNLLAWNERPTEVMGVVADSAADVLVLTEFNPDMHAALERRCGARYPYRIEAVDPSPAGIAVWSTRPMDGRTVPLSDRPSIDATVSMGATTLRVIGVHTEPPTMRAAVWSRELADIAAMAGDDPQPILVAGDFNAARWHPSFRRLLATGWVTAHEWLGRWWSTSWPHEGRRLPRFVRLDHALLRGAVAPVWVRDVPLPGSDHVGFVVCLSLADR